MKELKEGVKKGGIVNHANKNRPEPPLSQQAQKDPNVEMLEAWQFLKNKGWEFDVESCNTKISCDDCLFGEGSLYCQAMSVAEITYKGKVYG